MNKEVEELNTSEEMDASIIPEPVPAEDVTSDAQTVTEETAAADSYGEPEEFGELEASEETAEPEEEEPTEEEIPDEPEDAEETEDAEESEETEEPDVSAGETQSAPLNERILAIKSAIQQEETQLEIADKIRKYKTAAESGTSQETATIKTAAPSEKAVSKKVKKTAKKPKKKQKPSLFPRKGDGFLEVLRKCIFLGSSVVFIVCVAFLVEYFWNNQRNSNLNDDLDKMYQEVIPTEPTETTEEAVEEFEYFGYLPNVKALLEINPDVAGWISIPGTSVSYPILQRRGNPDGNEYYLKRNIYHEDAHAGSIFMDYRNDFDYVIDGRKQLANSGNLIVYGHNMHDYTMFGSLKHYINDANYFSEHPIVELNSNYRKYQYKIFAMIIVDVNDETDTRFDYWNKLEFADERDFYDYVNEIKRRTIRLTDVDVKYGDELLTLSTCNSTFSNGRLVVFARKLRDEEDLYSGTQTSTANPNVKWPNSYYRWNKKTYDPEAEFVPYG